MSEEGVSNYFELVFQPQWLLVPQAKWGDWEEVWTVCCLQIRPGRPLPREEVHHIVNFSPLI